MRKRLWIAVVAVLVALALVTAAAAVTKSTPKAKPSPAKVVIAKPLPKLLDLGADKCIPCKMMIPVLDQLKKEYKGKLTVEFIDVWKNPKAKDKYHLQMIPTQILYDAKGKELVRHQGYWAKEDILAAFKEHGVKLNPPPAKKG